MSNGAVVRKQIERMALLGRSADFVRLMRLETVALALLAMLCSCSDSNNEQATAPVLVIGAIENNPAWSRAGDRVAFFSYTDSLGMYAPGIYVVDSLGHGKARVSDIGLAVRWMSDDSALLINDGAHIFVQHLADSSRRVLALSPNSPPFDISADGRFVYFNGKALDTVNRSGVYKYDLTADLLTRISDGGHPAISPDGTKLLFARGYIFMLDLIDSTLLQMSGGMGGLPIWTHDGRAIIYDDTFANLYWMDLSGTSTFFIDGSGAMSISPDGDKLLFVGPIPDSQGYLLLWQYRFSDGSTVRPFIR